MADRLVGPASGRVVGVEMGHAFLPRVLVGLVGLHDAVLQGQPVAAAMRRVLQAVTEVQQLRAVTVELAGQLGGGDTLGESPHDQGQFAGPPPRAVQDRRGELEDPAAMTAAVSSTGARWR
jgi:hypothetical protein